MPFTLFGRRRELSFMLGLESYTPSTLFLSLHTASPGDGGSHAFEVSTVGTNYARQSLAGKMSTPDALTGISVNANAINFGPASASWGTVIFAALEDEVANEMIWYGPVTPPRTVNNGLPFQIVAGQFQLRL